MHAILFTDGSAKPNPGPSSIGGILFDMEGGILGKWAKSIDQGGSNKAEYEALRFGIEQAKKMGVTHLMCNTDSNNLVQHLTGARKLLHPELINKIRDIRELSHDLDYFHIKHVPREQNAEADALARMGHRQDIDSLS